MKSSNKIRKGRLVLMLFAVVFLGGLGGLTLFVHSSAFEVFLRRYLIEQIETRTGATVTLGPMQWSGWGRRIHIEDLRLRDSRKTSSPDIVRIRSIDLGLKLRSLIERHLDLFELTIDDPEIHVEVAADGTTNLPAGPALGNGANAARSTEFQVSIQDFKVRNGEATLKERQVEFDLAASNVSSDLRYQSVSGILAAHLKYDGTFTRNNVVSIPYTFDGDLDYSHATLLMHRIELQSKGTRVTLQGRIDALWDRKIHGHAEYTGNLDLPFLSHIFPKDEFKGDVKTTGEFDFGEGHFSTQGNEAAKAASFAGWDFRDLTSKYSYAYPENRALFDGIRSGIGGGSIEGSVAVEGISDAAELNIDLRCLNIDANTLSRLYPWNPRYRISSRLSGGVRGSIQTKTSEYDLSGEIQLKAVPSPDFSGAITLPLQGSTVYRIRRNSALLRDADFQLRSTHFTATGSMQSDATDLKLTMDSSDLSDINFLVSINGQGTFTGALKGHIENPEVAGEITWKNYTDGGRWRFDSASGGLQYNAEGNALVVSAMHIRRGGSEVVLNGSTTLGNPTADLTIQAVHVAGSDITPFAGRKIAGDWNGSLHFTSFVPLRTEGDLRADNLRVDSHAIGNVRGHLRYFDPDLDLSNVTISQNGSAVTGNFNYNQSTEAVRFAAHVNAVDLREFYVLGVPENITGELREADVHGDGSLSRPNMQGQGTLQNLSVADEHFSQVHLDLNSAGSIIRTTIDAGRNLKVSAEINLTPDDIPFSAQATFTSYSLQGTPDLQDSRLTATGSATFNGSLKHFGALKGQGNINSAEVVTGRRSVHSTEPFTFNFTADRLTLSKVSLAGEATDLSVSGTIGLSGLANLSLDLNGRVDLGLLGAAEPGWTLGGAVNLEGRIRGTPQNPVLSGVAHFVNAAFGKKEMFTSVSGLNGDVFFDGNHVTLNNIRGKVGGGTLQLQGTALIQEQQIQSMNIQIQTKDVRLRYPAGLRTIVNGDMVLRGALGATHVEGTVQVQNNRAVVDETIADQGPLLEGNIQIQSMSYRNNFDQFLEGFEASSGVEKGTSALDKLRLALHIQGGKNISIENQMANVEARVDVDVKGTVGNPALTGHVEASGGTLTFQGNRYQIARGNVDFVSPLRIDPVIDLQAETQIRDYRIMLIVTGKSDKLHLDMSSDPPLSQFEIVNLIAGGKTREELAASSVTVPTQERLFQGGAASILSDLLEQRIGNRLPILGEGTRIRVDPSLLGTESGFSPRITVLQKLSNDISLTYSQDLVANRQQVIQIEYFVSRNTSILASRDELGAVGLDVRLRKRFK